MYLQHQDWEIRFMKKNNCYMENDTRSAQSGKLTPDALVRSVFSSVGALREEVLIGPAVGEDAAVIRWPQGKLMVFASDPIVGASSGAGRLLVKVNVNDIASKGGEPAFIVVTLILPPAMGEDDVASIMREIHEECLANGIAIVGGHTEFNDLYSHPVLNAALVGTADRVFTASDIREGDVIFVSKHIGIEGMAILASDRPDLLGDFFAVREIDEIKNWMDQASILSESRLLREHASFMHDPTEGGFLGGLGEICRLAGLRADLSIDSIPLHSYTRRASEELGFDPLRLVASGSILAVVPESRVPLVERTFADAPIELTRVGVMTKGSCQEVAGMTEELWPLLKRRRN
jgi:hydrogenase maturation factor